MILIVSRIMQHNFWQTQYTFKINTECTFKINRTSDVGVPPLAFSIDGDVATGKDTAVSIWLTAWVEEVYVEMSDMCQSTDKHMVLPYPVYPEQPSELLPSLYLLAQGTISTYM